MKKYTSLLSNFKNTHKKYLLCISKIEDAVKNDIEFDDEITEDDLYVQYTVEDGLNIMVKFNKKDFYHKFGLEANGIEFTDFLKLKEKYKKIPISKIVEITYL